MRVDERVWADLDTASLRVGPPTLLGQSCGPYSWMSGVLKNWSSQEVPKLNGDEVANILEFGRSLRGVLVFEHQVIRSFCYLAEGGEVEETQVHRLNELYYKYFDGELSQEESAEFAGYYRRAVEHFGFCPSVLDAQSNCLDALYISAALTQRFGGEYDC